MGPSFCCGLVSVIMASWRNILCHYGGYHLTKTMAPTRSFDDGSYVPVILSFTVFRILPPNSAQISFT